MYSQVSADAIILTGREQHNYRLYLLHCLISTCLANSRLSITRYVTAGTIAAENEWMSVCENVRAM